MADFWEQKVRTHFRKKDLNKDGVITRDEFLGLGKRFAEQEKFDPQQTKKLMKCFDAVFSRYTRALGPHDDKLTEDLLVESLRPQRDSPGFKKALRDLAFAALKPMDVNLDGFIDAEEYRKVFENVGIVESDFTKAAFEAIDSNHDGKCSFEEFANALIEYMCSNVDNSAAMFGLDKFGI